MTNDSNESLNSVVQKKSLNPILNNPAQFPVVGVGASAGGLEALEQFFSNIPLECGIAFIVIQHLSPDFKSFMPELIGRITKLPTHAAEDNMRIKPNAIYILPPKKNLSISNLHIKLSDIEKTSTPNRPIDLCFQSLANELGSKAGAIVLSGTGSDGSLGIKAVYGKQGIILVQDPKSSKFDGMPRSALATNTVAATGNPKQLASTLIEMVKEPDLSRDDTDGPSYIKNDLKRLFVIIEEKYDVDFSLYKTPTIYRRLAKRLDLHKCKNIDDYIKLIEKEPQEVSILYYDMLIGVTQFFRDKEAFQILESKIIPSIFNTKKDGEEIRIWIPACASGEEVYSVAMLFFEFARINNRKNKFKIFGTDIDDGVLAKATEGVFKPELIAKIRKPLVDRYFTKKKDNYIINQNVRKSIVFARQNILKDPPFTKMDLISCRNLLIYFDREAQHDAQSFFYFALSNNGFLILGPSETLGEFEKGYETIDRKWKVFKKLNERYLPRKLMASSSGASPSYQPLFKKKAEVSSSTQSIQSIEIRTAFNKLLHDYVPPSLLIRENMELHHIFGEAGKYIQYKPGPIETNLKSLLSDRLAITVSVAIQRAKKNKTNVTHQDIFDPYSKSSLNIHVQMVGEEIGHDNSFYLVIFEHISKDEPIDVLKSNSKVVTESSETRERFEHLEAELRNTRENLQSTIEELETTNEELQSTNEELLASNEELQATNEELHSVNQELYTVNTEYQNKIDELTQLTNDEENFLKATGIGTIFLGPDLLVRKFTPAITKAFNILPQDIDRPIGHITHKLNMNLSQIISKVVSENSTEEFEVQSETGEWFIGKILPYITKYGAQDGYVITITDTTQIKQLELEKSQREYLLQSVIEDLSDGWWDWEMRNKKPNYYLSPKFKKTLGYEDYELENNRETWQALCGEKSLTDFEEYLNGLRDSSTAFQKTIKFKCKNRNFVELLMRGKVLYDKNHLTRVVGIQQKITGKN